MIRYTTGYMTLYIKGYIHRDVSIGNILLLETPDTREVDPLLL